MNQSQLIERFNQGYKLASVNLEMAVSLARNIKQDSSQPSQYFREGIKQFALEHHNQHKLTNEQKRDMENNMDF